MTSTLPSALTTSFSSVNATDLREDLRESDWSWGGRFSVGTLEDSDAMLKRGLKRAGGNRLVLQRGSQGVGRVG